VLGRVYAIAINTFREAVRDRILYAVLAFGLALLVFTLALAELSLDQQRRIVVDIGLALISLFAVVIAVFLGSSLLYKEIDRKTLYVILPKPIARHEFLVGKYFGIAITAIVFIALMGSVELWVVAIQAGAPLWIAAAGPLVLGAGLGVALWKARDRTAVLVPWSLVALAGAAGLAQTAHVDLGPLLAAMTLTVGEVLILAAVAIFFSSFSTPFMTGAFTLGVWLVGRSADEMIDMRSRTLAPSVRSALRAVAEIAPNFHLFVPGRHTLESRAGDLGGPFSYVASSMGYAVLYAAVVLTLAALIFRRRDFL